MKKSHESTDQTGDLVRLGLAAMFGIEAALKVAADSERAKRSQPFATSSPQAAFRTEM
ncbi:MAG: hypothetical protein J2P21_24850 [Chloracidobacterium sp.]|nr:hypothetical protein [Chloracidobacterium sp.]